MTEQEIVDGRRFGLDEFGYLSDGRVDTRYAVGVLAVHRVVLREV